MEVGRSCAKEVFIHDLLREERRETGKSSHANNIPTFLEQNQTFQVTSSILERAGRRAHTNFVLVFLKRRSGAENGGRHSWDKDPFLVMESEKWQAVFS